MSTFLVLVLSGALATVIGGVVLTRLQKPPWRRARVQLAPVASPVDEPSRTPVHHITLTVAPTPSPEPLDDVVRQIANLPPFQRHDMESHYVGLRVRADCSLFMVRRDSDDELRAAVGTTEDNTVIFVVPVSQQPFFKIMPQDHPIQVEGTITSITSGVVHLSSVQLTYPPIGPSLGKGS